MTRTLYFGNRKASHTTVFALGLVLGAFLAALASHGLQQDTCQPITNDPLGVIPEGQSLCTCNHKGTQ